jgi:hypothetical protein
MAGPSCRAAQGAFVAPSRMSRAIPSERSESRGSRGAGPSCRAAQGAFVAPSRMSRATPSERSESRGSRGAVEGQALCARWHRGSGDESNVPSDPERPRASEASRGGRGGRGARSCSTRISFVAAMVRCMPARPPTSTRGSRLTMRGRGQHGHVPGARWSSFTQSLSRAASKRSHERDSGKDGRTPGSSR